MENIYICPKCGYVAKDENDDLITKYGGKGECPLCGIIVKNYLNKKNKETNSDEIINKEGNKISFFDIWENITFLAEKKSTYIKYYLNNLFKKNKNFHLNRKKNENKEVFTYLNNFISYQENKNINFISYILLSIIFLFSLLIFNDIIIATAILSLCYFFISKLNSGKNLFPKNSRKIIIISFLPICIKMALSHGKINSNNKELIDNLINEVNDYKYLFENYENIFNQQNDVYEIKDYSSILKKILTLLNIHHAFRLDLFEILFLNFNKNKFFIEMHETFLLSESDCQNLNRKHFIETKDEQQAKIQHYLDILNCTLDSSVNDIKKAYREKSKKFHPDTLASKNLPDELIKVCNDKFLEINTAYEVLLKYYSN